MIGESMGKKNKIENGIRIALLLFLFLSLIQTVHALNLLSLWPDWITWTAIIMLGTAALIGIAFMVGKTFAIPSWEAFAKDEFANLLFTAFITVAFITFAGVIEGTANSMANDILTAASTTGPIQYWTYNDATGRWTQTASASCPYPCQFYIARGFLGSAYEKYENQVREVSKALATSKLLESVGFGFSLEFLIYYVKMMIAFGMPMYAGRAIFNNTLATVLGEFLNTMANLKLQETILVYLSGISGVFFVSGLLFRIPWFTRKLGGLLIAVGIGIYTIYPLAYVLAWYTVDRTTVTINEELIDVAQISSGGFGSPGSADISSLFTEYDSKGKTVNVGLLDALGRSYVMTIVIPMIAIFTTIGFIRQFSPMIGGDPQIAGLSRLI